MREKYVKMLREIATELDADDQAGQLDSMEHYLLVVINIVFTAFWFFQIQSLYSLIVDWRMTVSAPLIDQALTDSEDFIKTMEAIDPDA